MDRILHETLTNAKGGSVEIILRNGFHIYGTLMDFAENTVLVKSDGKKMLVMIGNVSTIMPCGQ